MTEDRILDKVMKLLAQAEHKNTGPEEAEAFYAKAQSLITQYQLDAAVAKAKAGTTYNRSNVVRVNVAIASTYFNPDAQLLAQVARANDCEVVITSGYGTKRATLMGLEEDVKIVEALFASLYMQMARQAKSVKNPDPWSTNHYVARSSFRFGFATKIGERLRAAKVAQSNANEYCADTSMALVLRSKEVAVAEAVTNWFPNLRPGRSKNHLDGDGYRAGQRAGAVADLGGPRVGSGGAKALPR